MAETQKIAFIEQHARGLVLVILPQGDNPDTSERRSSIELTNGNLPTAEDDIQEFLQAVIGEEKIVIDRGLFLLLLIAMLGQSNISKKK